MPPRDTRTGAVLEDLILPALSKGGYKFQRQVLVGTRPGGGVHKIDVLAEDERGHTYLISLKWQQVGGTAEQKVPFELICLTDIIKRNPDRFHAAYLVLGGTGWKLKDFYLNGGLNEFIIDARLVHLIGLEAFVARANSGRL